MIGNYYNMAATKDKKSNPKETNKFAENYFGGLMVTSKQVDSSKDSFLRIADFTEDDIPKIWDRVPDSRDGKDDLYYGFTPHFMTAHMLNKVKEMKGSNGEVKINPINFLQRMDPGNRGRMFNYFKAYSFDNEKIYNFFFTIQCSWSIFAIYEIFGKKREAEIIDSFNSVNESSIKFYFNLGKDDQEKMIKFSNDKLIL